MTSLFVIGTGPGDPGLVPPKARAAIEASTDLVAYGLYLDLLGDVCEGKRRHEKPLGEEIERARLALDLAAEGRTTALLSSGDIGIYAMATLVFELLDRQLQGLEQHPEWLDVDIEVIPGISAMQAGAAKAGALLGHDFCTISLSNLLTPWETIEQRVQAAGQGDFVVSFYNPVSKKRNWQLNRARDILLDHRPATTPVLIGRQLTRADESVTITTLAELDAADVDMFTLVSVGNRESRHLVNGEREWVYTPRGYRQKLGNNCQQRLAEGAEVPSSGRSDASVSAAWPVFAPCKTGTSAIHGGRTRPPSPHGWVHGDPDVDTPAATAGSTPRKVTGPPNEDNQSGGAE